MGKIEMAKRWFEDVMFFLKSKYVYENLLEYPIIKTNFQFFVYT